MAPLIAGLLLVTVFSSGLQAAGNTFVNDEAGAAPYEAYLFAYFTGNAPEEESIHFALSPDGLNFRALNNNKPIIASDTIADKQSVRDPHILRGPDGLFYMVVTDMKSANGWDCNNGMVLLRSADLINWNHAKVDIAALYPQFSKVTRVWAPQTIWDPNEGKFMIYWSMRAGNDPDVIHYAYANEDFTGLVSTPQVLFHHPENKSCIDGDIVFHDGRYQMFFKTEGSGNGIMKVVSDKVNGPYTFEERKYYQQTGNGVEGACVFRLINSDTWMLIYDVYTNGRYEFASSKDLSNFRIQNGVSMNFHARHGTVIPITGAEAKSLAAKWATPEDLLILSASSPAVKRLNMVFDHEKKTLFIPVAEGTNLKSFDPGIQAMPGVDVSPKGRKNFTKGPVTYTLSLNGTSVSYQVTAAVNNNPVVANLYADPDILWSEKTGKYYLYPTSDGYAGWYGRYFDCLSSSDLVNWTKETTIMDLTTDQVTWASTYAWAPCIVEKKVDGAYKYFYYFTARQRIGVAVASDPTGPFVDLGKPLIDFKPEGINRGQEIDPDVFIDPVSGKGYLYWGNGYMAAAELNDDMMSINKNTMKVITPDRTFREGAYVIYRNGIYYFMWSEDDTGSPNYKVRYGTSTSPLGPIQVPENNIVIAKDEANGILGTGHHSVVQRPGTDEWYIVYHRLNRPNALNYRTPGNYREVCIDRMVFNPDGSIKTTVPTLEGIKPLKPLKGKAAKKAAKKR